MTQPIATQANNLKYAFGSTIKMLDDVRFGGYLINFTDTNNRDLDNEYFSKATDIATPHNIEGLPLLFHHGLDPRIKDVPIGTFTKGRLDEHGLWVEGILRERAEYEKFVNQWYKDKPSPLSVEDYDKAIGFIKGLIRAEKIGFSSGANANTATIDDNGHITKWAIFEGSATHTPADPHRTQIHTLKSILDIAQDIDSIEPTQEAKESENPSDMSDGLRGDVTHIEQTTKHKDSLMAEQTNVVKMTDDEMEKIIKEVMSRVQAKMDGAMDEEDMDKMADQMKTEAKSFTFDAETATEEVYKQAQMKLFESLPKMVADAQAKKAELDSQLNEAFDKSMSRVMGQSQVGGGSHKKNAQSHISVSEDLRYAHLTADEMQANYLLVKAFHPTAKTVGKHTMGTFIADEKYLRSMALKSEKQADDFKDYRNTLAVKSAKPFKADEINASDITGQGDEWVGINYSTDLWEKARNQKLYQTLMSKGIMEVEVPQGHESTYVLTEGADPTVFTRQQANDLDTNTSTTRVENTVVPQGIGTGRVLLTPGELVTMVGVTRQATEDSLIPFLPQVNRQLRETMLETIDKLMINADGATGSNVNINLIDGTPSSTITSKPYYIATNGFLKYALVTGSGTSRDGGALDENDYRLTYKLFPSEIRERRDRMCFIIDPDTHDASLDIAAIKTDDVRRTNATITSGIIENIYGIDVYRTGFMGLANSAGKISGTPANNTLGRILAIYAPYWAIGWKRQISFEYDYDIYSATNLIAVSMRMGMVARGAGASTVSYNLTVA